MVKTTGKVSLYVNWWLSLHCNTKYWNYGSVDSIRAMREVESGDTVICDTMDDYLKLVGYGIQDWGIKAVSERFETCS